MYLFLIAIGCMFSLPPELRIEALTDEASSLVVTLSTTTNQAPCTCCQTLAWRVHSRYMPTLADLPCSGQRVTLRWQVRKWFCPNPACARKIFTEQVPTFTAPSARMTQRLVAALQAIAGGVRRCPWKSAGDAPRAAQQSYYAPASVPRPPAAGIFPHSRAGSRRLGLETRPALWHHRRRS